MTKKYLIMGLILGAVLTFSACSASSEGEGDVAFNEDGSPVELSAEDLPEAKVDSVDAFGVVTAEKTASISVDFNAKVEKLFVQTGEKIAKDTPLVAFDISDLTDTIKSKEREHAQLVAKLNDKNYEVKKLTLQLESEKKALISLNEDYKNKIELNKSGSLSADELKKAHLEVENKELTIQNIDINILSTMASIANEKTTLANEITSLTETINRSKDKLVKSNFVNGNQVVSTFDNAVVTEVTSKKGDFVNREVKILTLTDLNSRIVNADIAEEFIGKIKVGQTVIITTSALQGKEYNGQVSRIWGASVKKGGETIVPIEISINNLDDDLLLNFNVDVKINLES
ncbi:MAG: efflux RND transporter periplasmic adaptor subunit [Acidaminobacteraceae bacterium]